MDILQPIRKLNTKAVNLGLIYSVILLLGLNHLLYSFFDLGGIRNLVRAGAAGVMLLLLVLRLAEGSIRRRQVVMLLLAAWQILSGGTNGLNIAFLLILTVAVAGYRDCDISRVVFRVMVVLTAVMLGSLLLGIEENEIYTVGTRTRHKLGFVNVNSASMFLFTLLSAYLLHRDQKTKPVELAVVMGIEILLYVFTDSRTPLLGLAMMIAMYLLLPKLPERVVRQGFRIIIAMLFLTSYLWTLPVVNSEFGNILLSRRPLYCDEYFRNQSAWTFLFGGTRIPELDNGYLLLMFNVGVMVYTAVYFLIQSAAEHLLSRKQYMKLAFVITMLCCSVLEGSALRPELLCAPILWVIILQALPGEGAESTLITRGSAWLARRLGKDDNA